MLGKRLLIDVTAMLMVCAALLISVRLVANHDKPIGAAILAANLCDPAPCWQGIRPGVTLPDHVTGDIRSQGAIILADPIYDLCWYMLSAPFWRSCVSDLSAASIHYVRVDLPPGELRLGDAILQFGDPIALELCPVVNTQLPNLPQRFMGAFISFRHGVWLLAYNPFHLDDGRPLLDPNMIVWRMSYSDASAMLDSSYTWYGFAARSAHDFGCTQE